MPLFDLDTDDAELMELWHEQTRYHRGAIGRRSRIIQRFLSDPATIQTAARGWPVVAGEKLIALPPARLPDSRLSDVCANRESARRGQLAGELTLGDLATLLTVAVRSHRHKPSTQAPDVIYNFRPYPSPGALYPCEIFVIPAAVTGLGGHPHRYDPVRHVLVDFGCGSGRFQATETDACDTAPPCTIIIAAVLDRVTRKYGPRGYRLACLEAGHIGQNLILAATALDLPSLVYSAFYDVEVEQWLGLDGLNEVVLSAVLIGGDPSKNTIRGDLNGNHQP